MSDATQRAAIKTILDSISSIGNVYDYERWSSTWDVFLDRFKTGSGANALIKGWTLSSGPIGLAPLPGDSEPGERFFEATYTYTIRGYYGVNDVAGSEKTAKALAISVVKALASGSDDISPGFVPLPQLNIFEYRFFGNVLVHYTEIEQQVTIQTLGANL